MFHLAAVAATMLLVTGPALLVRADDQPAKEQLPQVVRTPDNREVTKDVLKLKQGPYRREQLAPEQIERVKRYVSDLPESAPMTLEEHLDGLRRDIDPDQEIGIWEHVVTAYKSYCSSRCPDADTQLYALQVLLSRSGQSDAEVLSSLKAGNVLRSEAPAILKHYRWKPIRITVGPPK